MGLTCRKGLCLELRIIAVIPMVPQSHGVTQWLQVWDGNSVMFRIVRVSTGVKGTRFVKYFKFNGASFRWNKTRNKFRAQLCTFLLCSSIVIIVVWMGYHLHNDIQCLHVYAWDIEMFLVCNSVKGTKAIKFYQFQTFSCMWSNTWNVLVHNCSHFKYVSMKKFMFL